MNLDPSSSPGATATTAATAVDLQGVRKVYVVGGEEVVALDHATLQVHEGEILALVGPSGSGKTTLCSIAGGILSAGVDGIRIAEAVARDMLGL